MLFSSYEFVLLFLPLTLLVYYGLGKFGHVRTAIAWLVTASLFFYGWWNPVYLLLLAVSIFFNYGMGLALTGRWRSKALLVTGIAGNLLLLGYFKYANFVVDNVNWAAGTDWHLEHIVLPLAISFFTFQQIAYLIDAWSSETREHNFLQYMLFIVFFPQLIAGPIVHHREMMPQFTRRLIDQMTAENLMAGCAMFFIGLFKKVMLADNIAVYANPVFGMADAGGAPTLFEAWGGALAYTLQLYFDFSGYADMAIGLALMFGIRLPLNFNSPYKSTSIIEFWRRWHMTLSRFLRDYLYIPLGGNRKGPRRRHVNLMITMLLGGLWHGAGWTFVIWGGLHGVYLVVNHVWRGICERLGWVGSPTVLGRLLAGTLTFLCVVVAWVFFRAESVDGAVAILQGMVGMNGVTFPAKYEARWGETAVLFKEWGVLFTDNFFEGNQQIGRIVLLLLIAWLLPNSQILLRHYQVCLDRVTETSRLVFKPSVFWFVLIYVMAMVSILHLGEVGEFLYFQF